MARQRTAKDVKFDCAVCGGPCRWVDRDENHKDVWGFYCDRCGVFSESDVEVED